MSITAPSDRPFDFARPLIWIAAFAFLTGFALRLAAGAGHLTAARYDGPEGIPMADHAAPSSPDWNTVKAI